MQRHGTNTSTAVGDGMTAQRASRLGDLRNRRRRRHTTPAALLSALAFLAAVLIFQPEPSADLIPALASAPNAANTGVPDGVKLTPSGSIDVTEDGAVIDGLEITGRVNVKASHVTIQNSRIDADGTYYAIRMSESAEGLTIIDSEILGAKAAAVGYGNYKAIGLDVHSSRDGFLMGPGSSVTESWIHDLRSGGVGVRSSSSSSVAILNNYIDAPRLGSRSAAVEFRSTGAANWMLEGNVLAGGYDTLRLYGAGVQVERNVWLDDSWKRSAVRAKSLAGTWTENLTAEGDVLEPPLGPPDPLVVQPATTTRSAVVVTLAPETTTTTAGEGGKESKGPDDEPTSSTSPESTTGETTTTSVVDEQSSTSTTGRSTTTQLVTTTSQPPPTTEITATTVQTPTTSRRSSGGNCSYSNPNDPKDDPNPSYNGSHGRYDVSSEPVPSGYPTPLNTGLCGVGLDGDDLKSSGSMSITQDGAVIDRLDINGHVKIEANNVTIKNSRITSSSRYGIELVDGYKNLTIQDSRIRSTGDNTKAAMLLMGATTIRRVHISGGNDSIKAYRGMLLEDSYITGIYRRPDSHNDIVQVRTGSDYTLRGNTMIGPYRKGTSVLIFQAKAGNISNVTIENNYMSGGGYTVYTTASDGKTFSNGVVRNNRFELDSWNFGWRTNNAGVTYHGNVMAGS